MRTNVFRMEGNIAATGREGMGHREWDGGHYTHRPSSRNETEAVESHEVRKWDVAMCGGVDPVMEWVLDDYENSYVSFETRSDSTERPRLVYAVSLKMFLGECTSS